MRLYARLIDLYDTLRLIEVVAKLPNEYLISIATIAILNHSYTIDSDRACFISAKLPIHGDDLQLCVGDR